MRDKKEKKIKTMYKASGACKISEKSCMWLEMVKEIKDNESGLKHSIFCERKMLTDCCRSLCLHTRTIERKLYPHVSYSSWWKLRI